MTVDAETFLPKLIEWRENGRPVSRIAIESIERIPRSQVFEQPRTSARPARTASNSERRQGSGCGSSARTRLTLAQARAPRPRRSSGSGRSIASRKLQSIDRVDWNAGSAYRIRYGRHHSLELHPTSCRRQCSQRECRRRPSSIPIGGNVAHFYFTPSGRGRGRDRPRRDYSVALVAPTYTKPDIIATLRELTPLR